MTCPKRSRALCAIILHVPCTLHVLMPHIPHALYAAVPQVCLSLRSSVPHIPHALPLLCFTCLCPFGALVPAISYLLQAYHFQFTLMGLIS